MQFAVQTEAFLCLSLSGSGGREERLGHVMRGITSQELNYMDHAMQ